MTTFRVNNSKFPGLFHLQHSMTENDMIYVHLCPMMSEFDTLTGKMAFLPGLDLNAHNDPWRTFQHLAASRLAVDLVGAAQAVEAAKSELVEGILQYYGTQALIRLKGCSG